MPGRGASWRGKGAGVKDRIGTEDIADDEITSADIKDLTIEEVDLSAAVTAKLNAAGGHVIQDEGTPLVQRPNMNFVGDGVTASDGGLENTTTVNIPGGGGGGITRELTANPFTDLYLYDEFFYPIPATSLADHYEVGTGTYTAPVDVIGGQVQFTTPNNSVGQVARINTCGAGLIAINTTNNFRFVVRLRKVSTDADTSTLMSLYTEVGQSPAGSPNFSQNFPPNMEFRSDGTSNWLAIADDGVNTPQSTDTGVVNDALFHTFEIRNNPGINIEFLIDDVVKATYTTNLPIGNMNMFIGVQTQILAFKSIVVDSLFLYQDR